MEPDAFPALATKPSGDIQGSTRARLLLGRRKQLQQREPCEHFLALDHPNFLSELGLADPRVCGCVTTAGAAEGAPGRGGEEAGGGGDRGVICEPQGEVGPGGGKDSAGEER